LFEPSLVTALQVSNKPSQSLRDSSPKVGAKKPNLCLFLSEIFDPLDYDREENEIDQSDHDYSD